MVLARTAQCIKEPRQTTHVPLICAAQTNFCLHQESAKLAQTSKLYHPMVDHVSTQIAINIIRLQRTVNVSHAHPPNSYLRIKRTATITNAQKDRS
jgi:hypothetical protein